MDKLREFIWERCQADDKATDEIISAIEGLVPEKKSNDNYKPFGRIFEFNRGYNACREEMLRRVNG